MHYLMCPLGWGYRWHKFQLCIPHKKEWPSTSCISFYTPCPCRDVQELSLNPSKQYFSLEFQFYLSSSWFNFFPYLNLVSRQLHTLTKHRLCILHTRDIGPVSISGYKRRNKFKLVPKQRHDKEWQKLTLLN